MVADVRPVTPEDILLMAQKMRDIDKREAELSTGLPPLEALSRAVEQSQDMCWTGTWKGKMVCMFGVMPRSTLSQDIVLPWLCATDRLPRVARAFLRANKELLPQMLGGAKLAYGYVLQENMAARRWLSWLGFDLGEVHAIRGFPFIRFEMRL